MHGHTLTGKVVAPWDPDYKTARLDYNLRFNRIFPDNIVYCGVIEDVSEAILWARRQGVPFRIRSGGHSYEAFSLVNHGLVIDVSRIDQVQYHSKSGLAQVGAGADLLSLYKSLWNAAQVTIPGGSCATVGIAGLTLGGGYGLISRQFGLTVDALSEVTMIDASGRRIRASEKRHPDLFWALRGGGTNNFGVVVELTFRTSPVNDVAIFFIQWPWESIDTVLPIFQQWSDPAELDFRLTPILTLSSKETAHISVVGEFIGSAHELQSLLAPLLAIPNRTTFSLKTMSYIDAVRHFAGLTAEASTWRVHGDHNTFKNTSAYAYEIFPSSALNVIQNALANTPGPACLLQLGGFGGAIRELAPTATAFYHRLARSEMQYQAYWTDPSQAAAHIRWVQDFRRAMKPYTQGAYFNYCDRSIKDWPRAYWGENLARLKSVKRQWDPHNLFRFPQGLSELTRPRC